MLKCPLLFSPFGRKLTEDEVIDYAKDCIGVLAGVEPYTKRVIDSLPKLRCISRVGTGMDSIDLDLMKSYKSENAEGKIIGKLRSAYYAKRKKAKGGIAKLGLVDLKNTGDFYDAIFAKVESKFIEISSSDSKTNLLEKKYGDIIFGLNDYYKQKYFEILVPEIIDLIRKYLKNGSRP